MLRGLLDTTLDIEPLCGTINGVESAAAGTIIGVVGLVIGFSGVVAGTETACVLKLYRFIAPVVTH